MSGPHLYKKGDRIEVRFLHSRCVLYDTKIWIWRRATFSHYEGSFVRVHLDMDHHTPDRLHTYWADRICPVGLLDLIAEV